MSHLRTWSCLTITIVALVLPGVGRAQQGPQPSPPPSQVFYPPTDPQATPPSPSPADPNGAAPATSQGTQQPTTSFPAATDPQQPVTPPPGVPSDAPVAPPDPNSLRTEPQAPLTENGVPNEALPPPQPEAGGVLLDGRPRQGPFLSGPGSFTFVLHHAVLGAMGGLFTQGFAQDFSFDRGSREAMLAGTLIGAGLGFGASSWWQFNNWVDKPLGYFGIANSLVGGMFMGGFMDLLADNRDVLAWSSFVGAELGAWLTATIGGGQLPLNHGLLVSSGAAWGLAYSALLLAIIHSSGTKIAGKTWADTLLIAPGVGAGVLAIATMRYNPTSGQILRANIFGGGVGAIVLLLSGLVLGGFDEPTPYVLSFLGSAGAITTVSLLWEESVDRTAISSSSSKRKPYKNVWW
ncbi:hypothetical protein [Hyalangium rubrum]|uniref:Uncharacterized protein n=1 Tax=Hyalangium rubrum TaxID=3103134 RepID=A0ABU5H3L9_9BACT|nr:hypothetical protein [Hyalangium sp. s54d21]MDY7228048.1 hypothetical protein [Hyalangium sp. s54d21]